MNGHREIVEELVAIRRRNGQSQGDIADRIDISRSAIGRIESNFKRSPTLATLLRYADAVGADIVVVDRLEVKL